jgi:hypothetical protein
MNYIIKKNNIDLWINLLNIIKFIYITPFNPLINKNI